MAVYKDEARRTWYVSIHYTDWTGKKCRKMKRGFKTKREAVEWEKRSKMKDSSNFDMTFAAFIEVYTQDMQPKLKRDIWLTKDYIVRTKILPYFKDQKMCGIRPRDIIRWQNKMLKGKNKQGKKYAPTYLKTL